MIINFAGADRSGKTEIAKELSKRLGIPYFKNQNEIVNFKSDESYFRNVLKYGAPLLLDFLKQSGCSAIFDRNYPCEWVYSQAMSRETFPDILKSVDEGYAMIGAINIICARKSYAGIVDDAFPDDLSSSKLSQINDLYQDFCSWSKCRSFVLFVDDENLDREISDILKFLEKA